MFFQKTQFLFNLLFLLKMIYFSENEKTISFSWRICEQCNSSMCGTKEVSIDMKCTVFKNATFLTGTLTLQIPVDDSVMIDHQVFYADVEEKFQQKITNVKFYKACSDIYSFFGGTWKFLWEHIPSKCPIPKGTYTLRKTDINQVMKQKTLFLPRSFIKKGYITFIGKLFKKRTGVVVGCFRTTVKVD